MKKGKKKSIIITENIFTLFCELSDNVWRTYGDMFRLFCTKQFIVKNTYNNQLCGNETIYQQKIKQSTRKNGLVNDLSTLSTVFVNYCEKLSTMLQNICFVSNQQKL